MYYYKFMKWFWTQWLAKRDGGRFLFVLLTWATFFIPTTAVALFIGHPIIIGYFMMGTIALAFIIVVITGIFFLRERYDEWQLRIVNEIKGSQRDYN